MTCCNCEKKLGHKGLRVNSTDKHACTEECKHNFEAEWFNREEPDGKRVNFFGM